MSAVVLGRFPVGTPQWHAARVTGVGGSEVAAILGLSKWESRFSLWHRKAGLIVDDTENDEMRAGRLLEPVIIESFRETHPELWVGIERQPMYCHHERRWQIASPDAVVHPIDYFEGDAATALLETKFALYPDEWGDEGTDQIPPYYLTQTRWYLDVFGLDTCYVHVFIGSNAQFRTYVVKADEADQEFMRDQVRAFLDSIETGVRPNIDDHNATYVAVRKLHPGIEPVDVPIPGELGIRYIQTAMAKRAAEAAAQQAAAEVLDAIGDGRRAMHADAPLAMRVPGRGDNPPFLRPCKGAIPTDLKEAS